VIVILAREADAAARLLAVRWGDRAMVLCCADIGQYRTAIAHPRVSDSTLATDERSLAITDIEGVLNLLPAVAPGELRFYPPGEREYQAAEFHALLMYLLAALPCRVINRPTSLSLNGPVFNALGWYHLASRAGIPLAPLETHESHLVPAFESRGAELIEVACLAGRLICESGTIADAYLLALAKESGVDYLVGRFCRRAPTDLRFVAANAVPDARAPWLEQALIKVFSG